MFLQRHIAANELFWREHKTISPPYARSLMLIKIFCRSLLVFNFTLISQLQLDERLRIPRASLISTSLTTMNSEKLRTVDTKNFDSFLTHLHVTELQKEVC